MIQKTLNFFATLYGLCKLAFSGLVMLLAFLSNVIRSKRAKEAAPAPFSPRPTETFDDHSFPPILLNRPEMVQ